MSNGILQNNVFISEMFDSSDKEERAQKVPLFFIPTDLDILEVPRFRFSAIPKS